MKPAPFRYVAAESIGHALALKAEHGDEARFLAGGQSLMAAMNFRLAQPAVLIDLNPIAELDFIRRNGDAIRVGALTRYRTLQRSLLIEQHQKLMHEALPHVAHPQIRNRGTLAGNLAHADPASEMPAVMLAIGGRLRAQSTRGERWIAAQDFFTGALTTAIDADELLTEIELPDLPGRTGTCFLEVARRRGDYAMMGVAATLTIDGKGKCLEARLAYCNAGATPIAASEAVKPLIGHAVSDQSIAEAASLVDREIEPQGNVHASAAFQRHLAGVLTRRSLERAHERARAAA